MSFDSQSKSRSNSCQRGRVGRSVEKNKFAVNRLKSTSKEAVKKLRSTSKQSNGTTNTKKRTLSITKNPFQKGDRQP